MCSYLGKLQTTGTYLVSFKCDGDREEHAARQADVGQAVEDEVESEQGVMIVAQNHGGQEETADQEGEVSQTQAGQQRGEDGPHLPDITGRITISPAFCFDTKIGVLHNLNFKDSRSLAMSDHPFQNLQNFFADDPFQHVTVSLLLSKFFNF